MSATSVSLAAGLFGPNVALAERWSFPGPENLLPAEAKLVENAAPQRQREFAAGRFCARAALARLGLAATPILSGSQREPLWPAGVVGSITHTRDYCLAAAALASDLLSIGIDAEPAEPLDAELIDSVCTPRELSWLASQPADERGQLARILFCAKEAFFKYQFPLTRSYLEFREVEIALDVLKGRFSVAVLVPGVPDFGGIEASLRVGRQLIIAGVASPASP